ncbi:MAG: replication protein [Deltaproteobacteria bacterium]|nr:poly-gamma-glutamate hydrolase family protein [Deltaproteobacteria bacterium]MBW2077454.1 poly-gamma-glutamate hydrolase family protein [Deltaproteobacteria bacterium]RLB28786.1 MAG: replication protein [Deltaproteobacteria bacterium]
MGDYRNYQQLMIWGKEGRDFLIHAREGSSGVAVIAPHGGGIEPGTMELADAIAGDVNNFYCFEGIKRAKNDDLHITSELFDEPRGVDMVKRSKAVLALHGCEGYEESVYVGGLDTDLGEKIRISLIQAGFSAEPSPRPEIQGQSEWNICNRCRSGKGVQLELSRGLRKSMFKDLTREGRKSRTTIFHNFVSVLRDVLFDW